MTSFLAFDETTSEDVCPVLLPSTFDALIQPDVVMSHLGGQFFTSPVDSALFRILHIIGPCRRREMILSPRTNCDQLLIRTIGNIMDFGNFSFQYVPQGEDNAIQLNVRYGKCILCNNVFA